MAERRTRPAIGLTPTEIEAELRCHAPIMWKMANQAIKRWPMAGDIQDFVQQACLGLLLAAERFDRSRDVKFLTYAYYWMSLCIRRFGHASAIVRTPETKPRAAVMQPSIQFNNDGDELPWELIAPEDDPEQVTSEEQIGALIHSGLNTLDPRDRMILEYRFGLNDRPRLTLPEVGQIVGLSKERVRQIEERALIRLRSVLCGTDANPRRVS